MQRDLDLAKDFQRAYLERPYPKIPAMHIEGRLRLEFYHRYKPQLALGGDFFDIITLGPDCAGVFVADVMGHGTRSALITSILRTLIGDLIQQGRNARHFISEMNKQFCGLLKSVPSPLFASAFHFVADTTARVATFSSAGHPAPFHIRRSLGRISRLEVPEPRGAALGLLPREEFTGGHCRLIPGDVFFFFTDGVYEAHNRQGEEFGMGRLESVLRTLMYKEMPYIVDGVMDALVEFVGDEPVADDICMVSVEVTTSAAKSAGDTIH
jgi:serine phosphatase RsbU (regulator of sigma subunit)